MAFQLGINWLYQVGLVRLSRQSHTVFFAGSFALLIGSSLIVGWLLNSFCREAAGSGIQVAWDSVCSITGGRT